MEGMAGGPFLFAVALVDTGSILFLLVYFVSFSPVFTVYKSYIITLSDLECDYLNAQECCSKLNYWVLPKLFVHGFLVVIFLLFGHWWLVCLNIPIVSYMIYEHVSVPQGNIGVYDPFQIYNRGQLKKYMRDCVIYLGWYLITFFIYLY
ncbi:hypothetical protein LSTR_LSTR001117, partial [Laodelphax striatellus]